MKKAIISIVLTLIVVLFFVGFIEIDNSTNDVESDAVVYSVNNIPNNLEKITNLSKRDEDFICATSRGMVVKDNKGNIVPSLASEINVKDDGIEYEFVLRDNIYWSDGSKISVEDIRDFFKVLIVSEDEENISAMLDIYGAKEFRNSNNKSDKDLAIIIDDNKLRFRLNRKNENFLDELSKPQYRLRESLSAWSDLKNSYNNIKYSGEYVIESIDDESLQLKRNSKESFNGPHLISVVKDENEELSMAYFEVGERDIVLDPPNSQLNRLYTEEKLITLPSNECTYIYMNDSKESVPMATRRELYRILYQASEAYESDNSKRVEVSEGSYFREDKEDITKLQTRKVSINNNTEWKKPDIITLLVEDTDDTRDFCRFINTWFKDKEDIIIRYSLVKKEDLNDSELQKRYDIVMFKSDFGSDRKSFYKSMESLYKEEESKILEQEIASGDNKFSKIEEMLFSSYKILPIMFSNKNIAVSDKIENLELDGNNNISFSNISK